MHIGDTLLIARDLIIVAQEQLSSGNTAEVIDTSALVEGDGDDIRLPRYRVLIDEVGEQGCSCTILERLE